MSTAIDTIGYNNCTGCFLCEDVCPVNAIKLQFDKEGFYKPYVKRDICINCGLCEQKCPVINYKATSSSFNIPKSFSGWNKDLTIRKDSSSGGLFTAFAETMIDLNGVVCGVKWENGVPIFDIVNTKSDLKYFRGSKYLQANANGIYLKIKQKIKQGQKVLFVGLPCQVQAAKNFINSELLITIDLVCAGVPSMYMYRTYCKEKFGEPIIERTNFRHKKTGWRNYSIEFINMNKQLLIEPAQYNHFFLAFNSTKCYNMSCYNCKFNTFPRKGDLTLCDDWGANDTDDTYNGVSALLINTCYGESFLKAVIQRSETLDIKPCDINKIIKGTPRVNMPFRKCPPERAVFFKDMFVNSFEYAFEKHIRVTFFKRIKNKMLSYLK